MAANKDRVPELDVLRLCAAISVCFFHLARGGPLDYVSRFGYLGVALFFVISGFVILWTAEKRSALEFAVTRAARLYPSYLVAVLICGLLWGAIGLPKSFNEWLSNASMAGLVLGKGENFDDVYWTLTLEMRFYLMVGAVLLLRQINRAEQFIFAWLLFTAANPDWFGRFKSVYWFISLDEWAPLFASGCLLYLIRSRGPTALRAAALAFGFLLAVRHSLAVQSDFTHLQHVNVPTVVILGAIYATMLAIAMRWIRLPGSAVWYVAGSLTYPLYLLHNMSVSHLLFLGYPLWEAVALLVLVTVAMGWAIERRAGPWLQHALVDLTRRRRAAARLATIPR